MTHDEALEALELAALEPGGLERLMAGDTATAAAVGGHVAGCASCAEVLERLTAQAPLLRDVIRTTPPTELRERTLAFVQARGVERGTERGVDRGAPADPETRDDEGATRGPRLVVDGPEVGVGPGRGTLIGAPNAPSPRRVLPWIAAIAAAVVLSVVATNAFLGARLDAELATRDATVAQLANVTAASVAVGSAEDARRIELRAADGSTTSGTLLFSASSSDLVIVATGLTPPPSGQEYRCWVVRDGERQAVGRMFFGGGLAYWVGKVDGLGSLPDGSTFGVSSVTLDGPSLGAPPVISGDL